MIFDFNELRLMLNDPLDIMVNYINIKLLKNKIIKAIFS